jgi:hypothetical protein
MALGGSHLPEALKILCDCWLRDVDQAYRKALLLPIALTRLDGAYEFLMELLEESHYSMALEAVKALQVFNDGGSRRNRIRQAVSARDDRLIAKAYRDYFEPQT